MFRHILLPGTGDIALFQLQGEYDYYSIQN